MKLYKIILWGVIGLTIGYGTVKLIWGEPFVFMDLLPRLWFLTIGIFIGWYFKEKK